MAVIESPSTASVQMEVDGTFKAARFSTRPLDYQTFGAAAGKTLGHYAVSMSTAAALYTANVGLCAIRWTDPTNLFVLQRIKVSVAVAAAVTAQRLDPIQAFVARGYTVRDATNATVVNLTGNNQKQRTLMGSSLVANLDVASAAAGLTGGTKTLDTNAFGSVGLSGAAIAALGTGQLNQDMYEPDMASGHHPITLTNNEGIFIQWGTTSLATGTVVVTVIMRWAEVAVF